MWYDFNDLIKFQDFDFGKTLLHEKSYRNNLTYGLWCKTLIGTKSLCIMLDKVNRFIRYFNGIKYLVLYGLEKYYRNYGRIRYLKASKSGIAYVFSNKFGKIKIDSDDDLRLKRTLTCVIL